MCGICGILDPRGASPETLSRMLATIAHRGPDDEGTYLEGPVGLGNRRLSIIDLETGHQPVSNEDGSVRIVFNGEIYNYRRLRAELERSGHRFSTRTDTEVIVHLYEDLGERCVERLNGMFALAIWDERRRKLFLARDRLGQKPLYYAEYGGTFVFASEIKGVLASGVIERELDPEALHHFLSLRFVPPPRTMFRRVRKLPAAHWLTLEDGKIRIVRYWDLSFRDKLDIQEKELLKALEEKLGGAVASHLTSDVPVGALLSGGMDSSMIVALMSKLQPKPLKTFAIGVEERSFDELPYARQVAARYGTEHREERVTADLIRQLPRIVHHMDEPSDPIASCMDRAASLASRDVKVVLGGDGGDELFAGFDRYQGVRYAGMYGHIPSLLRSGVVSPLLRAVPENLAYKSWTQKARWVSQLSSIRDVGSRYAEATCFFRFGHEEKSRLLGSDVWGEVCQLDSASTLVDLFNDAPATDTLDRMLYTDFMSRLPEHSLLLTDRMSMAHGLEVRCPYLDHELVEFMAKVPSEYKIRHGTLKFCLRKLAENELPRSILRRPKQGFMFPMAHWFREEWAGLIRNVLRQARSVRDGILNGPYLDTLLEEHSRRRVDRHVQLWMLLSFEVWYSMYFCGESQESMSDQLQASASGADSAPG